MEIRTLTVMEGEVYAGCSKIEEKGYLHRLTTGQSVIAHSDEITTSDSSNLIITGGMDCAVNFFTKDLQIVHHVSLPQPEDKVTCLKHSKLTVYQSHVIVFT